MYFPLTHSLHSLAPASEPVSVSEPAGHALQCFGEESAPLSPLLLALLLLPLLSPLPLELEPELSFRRDDVGDSVGDDMPAIDLQSRCASA